MIHVQMQDEEMYEGTRGDETRRDEIERKDLSTRDLAYLTRECEHSIVMSKGVWRE